MRRRCGSGGASGPGGGARCCRCVVAGALLLLSPCAKPITVKLDIPCRQTKTYEDKTRHRSTTRGEEMLPSPILLPLFPGGADIRAELVI